MEHNTTQKMKGGNVHSCLFLSSQAHVLSDFWFISCVTSCHPSSSHDDRHDQRRLQKIPTTWAIADNFENSPSILLHFVAFSIMLMHLRIMHRTKIFFKKWVVGTQKKCAIASAKQRTSTLSFVSFPLNFHA